MIEVLALLLGLWLIGYVLWDVFQSVVVPRPSPARFRLTRFVIRGSWLAWRWIALRIRSSERRDRWLGTYAPLALLVLLVLWVVGLIVGYGLVLFGLRAQIHPVPQGLLTAIYFAGTSLLTIGFGDIVATGWLARLVAVAAAGAGLGIFALTISLLFSLYSIFQRREVMVVTLDARAGSPPSGVNLLETLAKLDLLDELGPLFHDWERWSAEVLDSHLAYPILAFFRSSHDNESWVSALGAILDAATLALSTIDGDGSRGPAKMMFSMGNHLVEDLSRFFRLAHGNEVDVEREEFDQARERLSKAGYQLLPAEQSWALFSSMRATYADALNTMAKFWAIPPAQWIGDRSYIRHHPSQLGKAAGRKPQAANAFGGLPWRRR